MSLFGCSTTQSLSRFFGFGGWGSFSWGFGVVRMMRGEIAPIQPEAPLDDAPPPAPAGERDGTYRGRRGTAPLPALAVALAAGGREHDDPSGGDREARHEPHHRHVHHEHHHHEHHHDD